MRRGLLWGAVLVGLTLVAVTAALVVGTSRLTDLGSGGRGASAPTSTSDAAATADRPNSPLPAPPFAVGIVSSTFVDVIRATPARGPLPESSSRALQVTVRYPAPGAPGPQETPDAPSLRGRFPLVVFAHGYAGSDDLYAPLLHEMAAQGFVVAGPEFPLSSSALPGPPVRDPVAQAADLSFVVDRLLDPATRPVPIRVLSFGNMVGVVGHSDGGVTAVGFAASSCCSDSRVGAAVILSGALSFFPGDWFAAPTPPLLVVHAEADTVNPHGSGRLYDTAPPPKTFVVIPVGTHLGAFVDDPSRPALARLIGDFLRAHLLRDAAALRQLTQDANVPGLLELRAAE